MVENRKFAIRGLISPFIKQTNRVTIENIQFVDINIENTNIRESLEDLHTLKTC